MEGKICMITGANTGIGFEIAKGLAAKGADVVLVCRNETKGQAALTNIREQTGNSNIHLMLCDLSSQEAIHQLVQDFTSSFGVLDVLVNNAGALFFEKTLSRDGIEMNLATNYLGAFLLSELLVDCLEKAPSARVVNVVGRLHRKGKIFLEDLQFERQSYNVLKAGTQAVLAKTIFTYEFDRRYQAKGIRASGFHPGQVDSDFMRNAPAIVRWLKPLIRPFMLNTKQAAEPGIYLASSPELEGQGGLYFERMKQMKSSPATYDLGLASALWDASVTLTSLQSS